MEFTGVIRQHPDMKKHNAHPHPHHKHRRDIRRRLRGKTQFWSPGIKVSKQETITAEKNCRYDDENYTVNPPEFIAVLIIAGSDITDVYTKSYRLIALFNKTSDL